MKKGIIKWGFILLAAGGLIGGGIIYYMMNQPHRDVQAISADYQMQASELVHEYLADATTANQKYLQEEGNSKIIAVTGTINSISEDLNNQKVIFLKEITDKAGVSCTFTTDTNANTTHLLIGVKVTIKGVIRSGAGYDEDLELYEDIILEKCDIMHK